MSTKIQEVDYLISLVIYSQKCVFFCVTFTQFKSRSFLHISFEVNSMKKMCELFLNLKIV